jgi:hypothetical protein
MSLKDSIIDLNTDDVYAVLVNRLVVQTEAILAGAGDETIWRETYDQLRAREAEYLG